MNPITIAHLSDIHYEQEELCLLSTLLNQKGVKVETRLSQCFEHLKIVKPDIVLITGDMTHESSAEDFRYVKEQFDSELPGTPVLCTIGNHDIRKEFREGFLNMDCSSMKDKNAPYYDSLITGGYQFVSLDSAYLYGLKGAFSEEALDFLEEQINQLEKPEYAHVSGTFLLMHHPIMKRARHLACSNNERLEQLLKSGKIKGIFNGHVHGSFSSSVCGVPQFTADSLKTDFEVLHDRMNYIDQSGYQIVTFDENGDWLMERFLLNPKPDLLFEKMYQKK